jgi:DNA-binding phage protein
MSKTRTTRYDVADHLRTQEEMAAYLEACLEEANGDAAFILRVLGNITRVRVIKATEIVIFFQWDLLNWGHMGCLYQSKNS